MHTEKIRIYPNRQQRRLIDKILWECKCFYNFLLEQDNDYYKKNRCSPKGGRLSFYEAFRKQFQFEHTPAQAQQQVIRRLYQAWNNFFNKKHSAYMKRIKFKSIGRFRSFSVPQVATHESGLKNSGNKIYLGAQKIQITNLGKIRAIIDRPILGRPKTITIKKMKSGKYYAFVSVDGISPHKSIPPPTENEVGIDLGIEKFLVTSDGKKLKRPRFTNRHFRNQIKRAQRKLSRKKKGSKNREKQRMKLAKLHERVANQRRDFHFKVAHWLISNYKVIIAEDLEVSSMLKRMNNKGKLHRKLLSSIGLSGFLVILKDMCSKYNRQYIGIDPAYTSQVCSFCGKIVRKDLGDRVHQCPHCGLNLDRDLNAAINILSLGLAGRFGTVGTTGTTSLQDLGTLEEIIIPGVCS